MSEKTLTAGYFIVVEGIDQFAVTRAAQNLCAAISGERLAQLVHYPDFGTPIGLNIRDYVTQRQSLSPRVAQLLYSANRWEKVGVLRDSLANGCTAVCDRYSFGEIARGIARGLPVEWCMQLEVGLPQPDIVFCLGTDSNVAAQEQSDHAIFRARARDAYYRAFKFVNLVVVFIHESVSVQNTLAQMLAVVQTHELEPANVVTGKCLSMEVMD